MSPLNLTCLVLISNIAHPSYQISQWAFPAAERRTSSCTSDRCRRCKSSAQTPPTMPAMPAAHSTRPSFMAHTHNHVKHSCCRTWFVFVATVKVTSTVVSLLPVPYAVTDSILTSIVESFRDFATAALKSCAASVAGVSPAPVTRTMACVCVSQSRQ